MGPGGTWWGVQCCWRQCPHGHGPAAACTHSPIQHNECPVSGLHAPASACSTAESMRSAPPGSNVRSARATCMCPCPDPAARCRCPKPLKGDAYISLVHESCASSRPATCLMVPMGPNHMHAQPAVQSVHGLGPKARYASWQAGESLTDQHSQHVSGTLTRFWFAWLGQPR
jgi:hypothetical protein